MTNPFDIRRESDKFDGLFIVYDVRDGQTCRSFPFTVKRVSGEEYIPAAVAQAHAEDFAAELWARELADAPSVEPADDAPVSTPEAPTLTETFEPKQFPGLVATITPTSAITLEQDKHRGENSMYLVVDGTRHWLALWFDGFQHQRLLDTCEDVHEAALQVRDRLLRLEFEQQVADEPPVPTPATRIEYDAGADLFVAYVDGVERTAAPTQAACNAALERVALGEVSVPAETYARWRRVLSEDQIDAMFRASLADAVESIDDHARATADALKRSAAHERATSAKLVAFTEAFGG